MKKFIILSLLFFAFLAPVYAQNSIPTTGSSAKEGAHVFKGLALYTIAVNWAATSTPRYLMIFDATSMPSNGAVLSCNANKVSGCMQWCSFMPNSITPQSVQQFDWNSHPNLNRFGTVIAVSTAADCGTFTVDGANDFIYAQVQ